MEEKREPPLSINQAINKLSKIKDNLNNGTFKDNILAKIKQESQISIAPPQHRAAYLLNAINALEKVTAHGERVFLAITGEISSHYTRQEIGNFLREILRARIKGITCLQIATYFKKTKESVEALEALAQLEVCEGLKAKGFINLNDTPQ